MSVISLPNTTSPDEIAEVLGRDGVVVVDRLAGPEVMDELAVELRPWMAATATGPDDFSGRCTRRTGGLVARSPKTRALITNPLVLAATKKVLGHATSFQLHLTQVIAIGPGEPAQMIHRDQWAYDFFTFPKGFEVQCNTIWAMTDFTQANGATRVIPGSHHYDDKLRFEPSDTVPAEMAKGSVLFYTGSLYHGAGANHSNTTRVGINITYNLSWLRQEENQYLATPLEIARTLPVDLLRLMGYARGAYALGYVDDLRDPIEIVRPDLKNTGLGDLKEASQKAQAQFDELTGQPQPR
jgi:hypothetical protein